MEIIKLILLSLWLSKELNTIMYVKVLKVAKANKALKIIAFILGIIGRTEPFITGAMVVLIVKYIPCPLKVFADRFKNNPITLETCVF